MESEIKKKVYIQFEGDPYDAGRNYHAYVASYFPGYRTIHGKEYFCGKNIENAPLYNTLEWMQFMTKKSNPYENKLCQRCQKILENKGFFNSID